MNQPFASGPGAQPSAALQKEARVWLRTLSLGDVSPWHAEAFKRWLHTSPEHQAAFRAVKQRWDALAPGVAEMLRTNPEAASFHMQTLRGVRPQRRLLLVAATGAVAATAVAMVRPPAGLWPSMREWDADFRTATGEQRTLSLSADVRVVLNTRTSIRNQSGNSAVAGIELISGEAAIDLPPSGAAFRVQAGVARSETDSGRFEVRYLNGKACVTCLDGRVMVRHPAGTRLLQAGQQMIYDDRAMSGVASVDAEEASAWRHGELVFRQTRLSSVIDEINRYRSGQVLLLDEAAGRMPVSGRFAIASLDSALVQLERTFHLEARRLPGGLLVLS
ncbi:transmembrane sensor [Bordetella ansorpii]|uniref:Transmembrane sensor n=1 Tax=Bordetella ansorpii TaxID=288768 RepID=A0A157QKM2_9BORD|nr:FecR domain-containing protein [Bordetella ansorpii]SAI46164.1 transmembrane sensor [Bordetella ansorpii]